MSNQLRKGIQSQGKKIDDQVLKIYLKKQREGSAFILLYECKMLLDAPLTRNPF